MVTALSRTERGGGKYGQTYKDKLTGIQKKRRREGRGGGREGEFDSVYIRLWAMTESFSQRREGGGGGGEGIQIDNGKEEGGRQSERANEQDRKADRQTETETEKDRQRDTHTHKVRDR